MSITKKAIELHYNSAIKQAATLEKVAERLDNEAITLCNASQNTVQRSWKGISASAYSEKLEQLRSSIQKNKAYILEIASAIRKTAEVIRQSENAELEAENERK